MYIHINVEITLLT